MRLRRHRLIAFVALFALVATACSQQGVATDTVDTQDTGDVPDALASTEDVEAESLDRLVVAARGDINASPLWIADSLGFFEDRGIEVDFLPVTDADDLAQTMNQGLAQVAVESSATALGRISNDFADISFIAYIDGTNGGTGDRGTISLVAPTAAGGAVDWTGCDLVGQRIGVDSTTSLQAIALREMLRNSECSDTPVVDGDIDGATALPSDEVSAEDDLDLDVEGSEADGPSEVLELVEVDAVSLKGALQTGALDAGVFAEPNTTRLLRESNAGTIEVLVDIVANLDEELCGAARCANSVVVASNSLLDNNGELVGRFSQAIDDSIDWIIDNELEYRAALVSCCALSTSDASDIPKPNFVGSEGDLFADITPIIEVLAAQGKIADRSRLGSGIVRTP